MDFIEQLEERIQECDRAIERTKADRAALVQVLDSERRKQSGRKHSRRPRHKATEAKPPATPISVLPLIPLDGDGQAEKKTDVFRRFVRDHPGLPKKAVMAYGNKSIPGANKNFGYTAVAKLLKAGELEVREGKVYPLEKLLQKVEATAGTVAS